MGVAARPCVWDSLVGLCCGVDYHLGCVGVGAGGCGAACFGRGGWQCMLLVLANPR